jgi:hypothetical protein
MDLNGFRQRFDQGLRRMAKFLEFSTFLFNLIRKIPRTNRVLISPEIMALLKGTSIFL